MALIDDVLPHFDVHEVHSIACARSLDEALAAPFAPDPIVRLLFRLRGLRATGTIGEAFARAGFQVLARNEQELVVGAAGTPWRPRGGVTPFSDERPGTVRMVANLLADGTRVSTETRVQAVDDAARRAFRRYWLVVGPFSAVIRRRWLKHIAA
jgi:hypothetical protein